MTPPASRYAFRDYDPTWPAAFRQEADRIRCLIGDLLLTVHHIGSTAVPGVAAKPVIDLLPVVHDIGAVDARQHGFEDAGYRAWGECGIAGRRYFTLDQDGMRTHNVHVFGERNPAIERHLAFRAYLGAHDAVRDEYAALKREVFARHPADIQAYMDGKGAWIQRIQPLALEWYRNASTRSSGGEP